MLVKPVARGTTGDQVPGFGRDVVSLVLPVCPDGKIFLPRQQLVSGTASYAACNQAVLAPSGDKAFHGYIAVDRNNGRRCDFCYSRRSCCTRLQGQISTCYKAALGYSKHVG